MALNPTTFRHPFAQEIEDQTDGVQAAHRYEFSKLLDLDQAISAISGKLTTATQTIENLSQTINSITTTVNPYTVISTSVSIIGVVGNVILCDVSGGGFPIYLPQSSLSANGVILVKNNVVSANVPTITPFAGDNVDGQSLVVVPSLATLMLISNGVLSWRII